MNLQLGKAVQIVMQTAPYIAYRALVYGAICICVIIYLALIALIGLIFGGGAAFLLLIISLAAAGFMGLLQLVREYVLYMLKAGHIALIAEIVNEGELPSEVSQTEWAKERVTAFFKEISVLALVDQLVKGIIRTVNNTVLRASSIVPIPGVEGAGKVAQRIVDFSLTYVDETILAYAFKTKNDNVYEAAKTSVILYCQAWKGLLTNAVALTLLSYMFVFFTTLIFLVPLGIVALLLPAGWTTAKFALFAIALFLGISLKWILFDPIACTSTILTYFREIEHLEPDPEWEQRLDQVSDKFRELSQKARDYATGGGTGPHEPETGPESAPEL